MLLGYLPLTNIDLNNIIDALKMYFGFGFRFRTMFFTNSRLIIVATAPYRGWEFLIGQWGYFTRAREAYNVTCKLNGLTPAQILESYPASETIPYQDITTMTIVKPEFSGRGILMKRMGKVSLTTKAGSTEYLIAMQCRGLGNFIRMPAMGFVQKLPGSLASRLHLEGKPGPEDSQD